MPYDRQLAARVRQALDGRAVAREKAMFGGLSFLVRDRIALVADAKGDLMVRCAPDRAGALMAETGAERAVMRDRPMSTGWLVVGPDADVDFWVEAALDHNSNAAGDTP